MERRHLGSEQPYATDEARAGADARGFRLSPSDWRAILLGITDTFATDGQHNAFTHITAMFVGPVRQGERWTIFVGRRAFDALYDQSEAVVFRVIDPPSAMVARAPVPVPLLPARIKEAA